MVEKTEMSISRGERGGREGRERGEGEGRE